MVGIVEVPVALDTNQFVVGFRHGQTFDMHFFGFRCRVAATMLQSDLLVEVADYSFHLHKVVTSSFKKFKVSRHDRLERELNSWCTEWLKFMNMDISFFGCSFRSCHGAGD